MDVSVRTEGFQGDNQSWLGSAHGTSSGDTITLSKAAFTAGTHYPNGFLPSGTALGKITSTVKYGPYNDAASNGTEVLVGFLLTPVAMSATGGADVGASILKHGEIVAANLPFQSGTGSLDAAGRADVAGRIWFE